MSIEDLHAERRQAAESTGRDPLCAYTFGEQPRHVANCVCKSEAVVLSVPVHVAARCAEFMQTHRHDWDTSEALDDMVQVVARVEAAARAEGHNAGLERAAERIARADGASIGALRHLAEFIRTLKVKS